MVNATSFLAEDTSASLAPLRSFRRRKPPLADLAVPVKAEERLRVPWQERPGLPDCGDDGKGAEGPSPLCLVSPEYSPGPLGPNRVDHLGSHEVGGRLVQGGSSTASARQADLPLLPSAGTLGRG